MLSNIHTSHLTIISATTGPESIVIGIASVLLLIAVLAIIDSGITSKKGRNQNTLQKKLNRLNKNINDLDSLHQQGILNKKEYVDKSIELEKKRIEFIVEQELNENEKFEKILEAYKSGLITEVEKDQKVNSLKNKILKYM